MNRENNLWKTLNGQHCSSTALFKTVLQSEYLKNEELFGYLIMCKTSPISADLYPYSFKKL